MQTIFLDKMHTYIAKPWFDRLIESAIIMDLGDTTICLER